MLNAEQIFKQFKKTCPNSRDKIEEAATKVEAWKYAIQSAQKREKGEKVKRVKPTEYQLKRFELWKSERKFPNVDTEVYNRIMSACQELIDLFSPEKVYLTGSYLGGDWIDENTPIRFRNLKEKVKRKSKISDIDFITVPPLKFRHPTSNWEIRPDVCEKKLLIYDNDATNK